MAKTKCDTCKSIGEHDCEVWTPRTLYEPSKKLILCNECFFEERYENEK